MSTYLTDDEQVEQLKQWWKDYGKTALIGILIALAVIFGWRGWQRYETNQSLSASLIYDNVINSASSHDEKGVQQATKLLINKYERTPYAAMAALVLGQQDIKHGNLTQAQANYIWAMKNTNSDTIKQIARLRVARVMIEREHAQLALSTLSKVDDAAYEPLINLVQGEAYVQLKQYDQAQAHLKNALDALPKDTVIYPLVKMKYTELASKAKIATPSEKK